MAEKALPGKPCPRRRAARRALDRLLAGENLEALAAWFEAHPDVRLGRLRSAPWLQRVAECIYRVALLGGCPPAHLQKKVLRAFVAAGASVHEVGRPDGGRRVPVLAQLAPVVSSSVLAWMLRHTGPFAAAHLAAAFRAAVENFHPKHVRLLLETGVHRADWVDALLRGHDRVSVNRQLGFISARQCKALQVQGEEDGGCAARRRRSVAAQSTGYRSPRRHDDDGATVAGHVVRPHPRKSAPGGCLPTAGQVLTPPVPVVVAPVVR